MLLHVFRNRNLLENEFLEPYLGGKVFCRTVHLQKMYFCKRIWSESFFVLLYFVGNVIFRTDFWRKSYFSEPYFIRNRILTENVIVYLWNRIRTDTFKIGNTLCRNRILSEKVFYRKTYYVGNVYNGKRIFGTVFDRKSIQTETFIVGNLFCLYRI